LKVSVCVSELVYESKASHAA